MFDHMLESKKEGVSKGSLLSFPIALLLHVIVLGSIIVASYVIVEAVIGPQRKPALPCCSRSGPGSASMPAEPAGSPCLESAR